MLKKQEYITTGGVDPISVVDFKNASGIIEQCNLDCAHEGGPAKTGIVHAANLMWRVASDVMAEGMQAKESVRRLEEEVEKLKGRKKELKGIISRDVDRIDALVDEIEDLEETIDSFQTGKGVKVSFDEAKMKVKVPYKGSPVQQLGDVNEVLFKALSCTPLGRSRMVEGCLKQLQEKSD